MSSAKRPWSINWEVIERLGKGGQGEAHLVKFIAEPTRLGVLKTLRNNTNKQARGRMHIEVGNLDALSYEGIKVPSVLESNVADFKDATSNLYFVMDYIKGSTLAKVVETNGTLPLDGAAAVLADLASTIEAAHKMAVFHRDLKPANIMVRNLDPPDLVIVDYGLSFNAGVEEDESVTVAGEQFRNEFLALGETNTPGDNKRDPRIDVTALCAVFYYILTGHVPGQIADGRGRPPHRRDGSLAVRHHLANDERCTHVELLFDRGFALNVEHRFQTCSELIERLSSILQAPRDVADDPKTLAAMLGKQLRENDRKTQLEAHRVAAMQVLSVLQQKLLSEYHQQIKPFEMINIPAQSSHDLPAIVDKVAAGTTLGVTFAIHNIARQIRIGFGAEGNQTVMLMAITNGMVTPGNIGVSPSGVTWDKVAWFTPSATLPEDRLREIIRRYVNRAMRELYEEAMLPRT